MSTRSDDLLAKARQYLIPHKAGVMRLPIFETAQGTKLTDVDGKVYLDFLSGQVCSTIGHSHPAIVDALHRACDRALHMNVNFQNEDSILLAEELATILPPGLSRTLFKSTGSEANEVAIHLAKKVTGNWEVVALANAFHGLTSGPRSSTYAHGARYGYGPMMPGTFAFPVPDSYRSRQASRKRTATGWECEETVAECLRIGAMMFDVQSAEYPAAVLVEPILSAGGVTEPPASFLRGLKKFAEERGMLFIMDECQTGLGRAGEMLVSNDYGFTPDVITLSKTLGGGLPVSSVSTTPEITDILTERRFNHSASHVNDPFAALVGLAVLRVLKEEGMIEQSRARGNSLKAGLEELAERWPLIGDVRGRGLLIGMELVSDPETREPAPTETRAFFEACLRRGLLMNICGEYDNVIRMMPPITISQAEIASALTIMDEAMAEVCQSAAAA